MKLRVYDWILQHISRVIAVFEKYWFLPVEKYSFVLCFLVTSNQKRDRFLFCVLKNRNCTSAKYKVLNRVAEMTCFHCTNILHIYIYIICIVRISVSVDFITRIFLFAVNAIRLDTDISLVCTIMLVNFRFCAILGNSRCCKKCEKRNSCRLPIPDFRF